MTTPTPPPQSAATRHYLSAHVHASQHRAEIEASSACGCFFCFRTFGADKIKSWVDANQTALCPHCGLDAVIANSAQHALSDQFLRGMHKQFFSYRSK